MQVALFRGCIIPYRFNQYEKSAKIVLNHFGIEVLDLDGFTCCGSVMSESESEVLFLLMAARNLALADKAGLPLVTLCGSCTGTLTRVRNFLLANSDKKDAINEILGIISRNFTGVSEVKHVSKLLYDSVGIKRIKQDSVRDFSSLKVAVQIPCQIVRPSQEFRGYRGSGPDDFIKLIRACGVNVVNYEGGFRCCGSTLLPLNKSLALKFGERRIREALDADAELLVIGCGNCAMMFDFYQSEVNVGKTLPTIFFTQLMASVLGYSKEEIGLDQNITFRSSTPKLLL